MSWVKIDDHFPEHPKVLLAGPQAAWLYVCGLAYASRNLTDGFIPAVQVKRLAEVSTAPRLAAKLVGVGLWEETEGGYLIHDYLEYNPSREKVLRDRAERHEEKARAGRAGGKRSAEVRWGRNEADGKQEGKQEGKQKVSRTQAEGQAESKQKVSPVPYPYPSPSGESLSDSPSDDGAGEGDETVNVPEWAESILELKDLTPGQIRKIVTLGSTLNEIAARECAIAFSDWWPLNSHGKGKRRVAPVSTFSGFVERRRSGQANGRQQGGNHGGRSNGHDGERGGGVAPGEEAGGGKYAALKRRLGQA